MREKIGLFELSLLQVVIDDCPPDDDSPVHLGLGNHTSQNTSTDGALKMSDKHKIK